MKHALLGLSLLVLLTGCNDFKVPEDPKPPIPFNRIYRTSKELWIEYLDNPTKSEKELRETRVRITGKLLAIDINKLNQDYVLLIDSDLDYKHCVIVGFPKSWRSSIKKLKVGESNMVEGVFFKAMTDPASGTRGLTFNGTAVFYSGN